ncbi:MAG: T9SS type A sorting domain-containing protein [Bacteroidetes bacterium]|nr:MAG: T9SS type A sorting domain-containing protein [Bacteroidota bacterium]
MKKFFTTFIKQLIFLIFILSLFSFRNLYSLDSKDFVVFLTAEVSKTETPSIKINWKTAGYSKEYHVYRKVKESNYWGNEIAILDSTKTSFIDNNVTVGDGYEYQVLAYSIKLEGKDTLKYFAAGYIYAGIEVKPIESYGTVLLIVESNLQFYFQNKIDRLKDDLLTEGWNVNIQYVTRSDSNNNVSPTVVRNIIKQEYAKDKSINTVFLFGRVPVPYTGNFGPDAHDNHQGAWPADVYYGILDDTYWTDSYVNTDSNGVLKPSRNENRNIPGDGKFDQTYIREGDVVLRIGRVDFYNMPAFKKTEEDLLGEYLDKDHLYRSGEMSYVMRSLVDINFQPSYSAANEGGLEMGFGASGWRNFAPFFGMDSIKNVDWFTNLKTDNYLWAYGCGAGWYTSADKIGNTTNFADTNQKKAIFTMLFGSYFGDWDSQNNFLRAGLCSSPSILTCAWAGRPQWYLHHMALGLPIGYSTMLSQNNGQTYIPNICYTPRYKNGVVYTYGNLMAHVALMGDPTLRMYMGTVSPAKNLSVIQPAGEHVEISWEKSDNQGEYLYNVYLSSSKDGPFTKINEVLLSDTSFTDPEIRDGIVYYMVRDFKVQNTMSGSFYNSGIGVMKSIQATDVNETVTFINSLTLSPNPATTNVNIELSLEKNAAVSLDIYDVNGNRVINLCSRNLAIGTHSFAWNMLNHNNLKVSPGVYFVKLTGIGISNAVKFIVMP